MNKEKGGRKIFLNFSFLALGKMLGDVFTFVLFVALSRAYGPDGIGEYSFAIAFTGFFAVFSDFGLHGLSLKELSRVDGALGPPFSRFFTLRIFLSLSVLILLFIALPFLPFSYESKLILVLVGIYQVLYRVAEGFSVVYIAREEAHISGILELSLRAAITLIGIIVILMGGGLVSAILVFPVITAIQATVSYIILCRRYGKPQIIFSLEVLKKTFHESVPFGFSLILYQLYSRVDVILLGFLISASAAGIYNVAYRIVFMLLFVPHFAAVALTPQVSRLYLSSKTEMSALYTRTMRFVVLIGLPVSAGLWLTAGEVIHLIYGEEFEESILVLQLVSWLIIIFFLSRMMMTFLTCCELQSAATKLQWITAAANVIGNLVLIPKYGVSGAAVATLISESILVLLFILRLKDELGLPDIMSSILISLAGTITFCIVFIFLPSTPLYIVIPGSFILYITVLMLFEDTRKNEIEMITKLIGGFK